MTTSRRRCAGDEGSTLILAITVMMILATLTMALQARTLSSLKMMRHSQDSDAALAAADAGLAKAVYRIENGQVNDWFEDGYPGCPWDDLTSCENAKWPNKYRFQVQRVGGTPPTEFIVSVRGKVGGGAKAIRALVTRDALFPYALFGYQNLTIDGSTDVGNVMQFSVAGAVDASSVGVRIGSNGMITCRGNSATNVRFDSFGGFSGCPANQWTAIDQKRPRLDIDPPPIPNRACPTDGRTFGTTVTMQFTLAAATQINAFLQGNPFGALISAAQTAGLSTVGLPVQVIDGTGGPFICRRSVTLSGIVMTTGSTPVQIYVLKTTSGACNTLDISDALINSTAAAGQLLGKARMFQIYKDGDCDLTIGSGNTSDTLSYNGVLYAPDSVMTVNGGKQFQGSIMVGQMKINGGPNIIIKWDDDLKTYYGQKWRVSRYAEVSNSDLNFTGP
ncbi:MAG TPA: hypothetical protein VM345_16025 [Acidimicrobiales bacterium]|nr:hypothetical protein [Acidimicrobiales bacterium]